MMDTNKRIALLMVVLVVMSFLIVGLRHQSRLMFVELQGLQKARDDLNIEWGKLLLEEGAWSQHRRVESTARERMGMNIPAAGEIAVIDLETKR